MSNSFQFGIVLRGQYPIEDDIQTRFQELAAHARTADALGFDSITCTSHFSTYVTKKIGATAKKKKISRVPPNLEIDPEVLDFIEAIDRYKKKHNRPFPSWSEVLYVFRKLGYKKS